MNIDELSPPSASFKADDLEGDEVTLTIASYIIKEFEQEDKKTGEHYTQRKPIVSFKETDKTLVLNKTNRDAIAYGLGTKEMDEWVGKKITLFPTVTSFGNDTVPCIRIRVSKTAKAKPKFLKESENPGADMATALDDEIPFSPSWK